MAPHPNRRRFLRLTGVTLASTALAGCSAFSGSSDQQSVSMNDQLAYEPKSISVAPGTTVTWTNDSDVDHTVTAYEDGIPSNAEYFASGGFTSEQAARNDMDGGLIAAGDRFKHTFEVTGTYEYFCIPHEGSGMTGAVQV